MKNWLRRQWLKVRAFVYSILLALGLAMPLALADSVTLSWTNATQNVDGTPLAIEDIAETRIYRQDFPLDADLATEPRTYTVTATVPATQTTLVQDNLPNGIYCYVGTHMHVNGQESAFSGEACKTIDVRVPGSPENMTAQ